MNKSFVITTITAIIGLSVAGCSIYQSEGREFLEEKAFDFAFDGTSVSAKQKVDNCAEITPITTEFLEARWTFKGAAENLELWDWKGSESSILTYREGENSAFICEFTYLSSQQQLIQRHEDIVFAQSIIERLISSSSH